MCGTFIPTLTLIRKHLCISLYYRYLRSARTGVWVSKGLQDESVLFILIVLLLGPVSMSTDSQYMFMSALFVCVLVLQKAPCKSPCKTCDTGMSDMFFIFLFSFEISAGLVPWFLYGKTPPKRISSNIDVLDHFTQAEKDGSKIIWIHEVNSLHSLHEALQSKCTMLYG